ncbi:hypothetical protein PLESTB_001235700 [Pleodorina starrii]|uniref:Uncharacterized protein n=1 Tax=Pleodorina starrii TaxID=330485 RepID=A0A9W6BSD9_9CHLO|nr:hypothetical protein PLESTM_000224100 [Pleodorina starrii]GLC57514.1 hypothetical protein PLESTB_001235700 [Pleodorina starrii]
MANVRALSASGTFSSCQQRCGGCRRQLPAAHRSSTVVVRAAPKDRYGYKAKADELGAKSPAAAAAAAFAAAVLFLAPSPAPAADIARAEVMTVAAMPQGAAVTPTADWDLTSWLTEKLRVPEPEPVRVGSGASETVPSKSSIVQGVKDAASAAASKAADAANRAADAASRAADRAVESGACGGPASSSRPIDIPTNSELLSGVAKPSPAPGKGPIEKAARAEARSECTEPALRQEAAAAGRAQPADQGPCTPTRP